MKNQRQHTPPNDEQMQALFEWRDEHGDENWKRKLTLAWLRASAPATLHALRNSHGPSWLHSFTLPKIG